MTCEDARAIVEAVAAGERDVGAGERAHFESCPRCASVLASARRLEAALRARPVPSAPPGFTAAVLVRLRRERWRVEQQFDWLFNAAIVAGVLVMLGGLVAMFNVGTVLAIVSTVWGVVAPPETTRVAAPSLAIYVAAAGLLATALAMWWWAERTWSW